MPRLPIKISNERVVSKTYIPFVHMNNGGSAEYFSVLSAPTNWTVLQTWAILLGGVLVLGDIGVLLKIGIGIGYC